MKPKYLIASLFMAAFAMAGCQETAETYPALYITEAQVNTDKSMTIDTPPAATSFTVSSSVAASQDIDVELEIRPDLLEAYNAKYQKNYQLPPQGCFELESTNATILAGYNTSSKVNFVVNSISEFAEGVTYCVPVAIKSASGDMTVLEPSRVLYIVLKTPVFSKAMMMGPNIYEIHSFKDNSDVAGWSQLTLEARVYMLDFCHHDPYISSVIGIEGECLVRFGDVKVDKDCIQICHESYQPAATDKPFSKNRWYHVAAVWTGSSWDLYIDGQFASGVATQGETIDLSQKPFYLGASYGRGRTLNGYMAECRVWKRALTQAEIANNMNYVDPQSDGLVAYWRMNEWEPYEGGKNVVRDLTGHGYDAIGDSSKPEMIDTKWL